MEIFGTVGIFWDWQERDAENVNTYKKRQAKQTVNLGRRINTWRQSWMDTYAKKNERMNE
jgi:hypothetical protein